MLSSFSCALWTSVCPSWRSVCLGLTPIFLTVARTWKQAGRPFIDEWIGRVWAICTMECYSALKRNGFESVLVKRMNIESVMQGKVSQKEKNTVY